ncbi:hypothetical protein AAVH_31110, partial [Aphelenchoides avenae]
MLRLSRHVIFLALLLAVIKCGLTEADASLPKYAGYGGYANPRRSTSTTSGSPTVNTGATATIGSHGKAGPPTAPTMTATTPTTTTDDGDSIFNQALAITIVPLFAAENRTPDEFRLLQQYLSLQINECHPNAEVHYSLGIFNAYQTDWQDYDSDFPQQHYCDQCDCQAVITSLTPANVSISKHQNFTLENYLGDILYDIISWHSLSTPMIILVTNIKCDEVDQYASLQGMISPDNLDDYNAQLFGTSTRVLLIWIDPGKDWKQKCNLTKLESSQFRVRTHSSLKELVRSIAKPCPLTGLLSTTRPLSTSTRSSALHSPVSPDGGSGGTISKGALIAIICASVFTGCVLAFALYCVFRRKCSNDSRFFGGPKVAPRFPIIPVIAPSFQPSKEDT